jgi:hypothetical protein
MLCSGSSNSTDCCNSSSSTTCSGFPGSVGQLGDNFQPGGVFACSAFLDASSLTAAVPGQGGCGPGGGSAAMPAQLPAAAAGQGVSVTVEREVVYPGCPMNSYPAKNKDNSQCIMCGEFLCGSSF